MATLGLFRKFILKFISRCVFVKVSSEPTQPLIAENVGNNNFKVKFKL